MTEESISKAEKAKETERTKDGIQAEDSMATSEHVEDKEGDSEIIWTKDTKTGPGEVNWRALAAEFTWEKLWTSRDWNSIVKHFLLAFSTGFFFAAFDVFTDGWSGFTFIFGTDYIENVASPNDTSVADGDSCKNIGRFVVVAEDGSESVKYYQYRCFEKDPIYGIVTLAFMFFPGLWGGLIWSGLEKQVNRCVFVTVSILTLPFFPVIVIGTKLLGLFNPGPEMKKVLARVNYTEGTRESTMQFGLQLLIVMSRKDRTPSSLQWATILTSFFMLNKTGIESYLRFDEPSQEIKTTVRKIAGLLPMFLTGNFFKLVSGALLSATLYYWTVVAYMVVWIPSSFVTSLIWRGRRERTLYLLMLGLHPLAVMRTGPTRREWSFSEKERMQELLFGNAVWFVGTSIFLIVALVLASVYPSANITTIGFLTSQSNTTTHLPISPNYTTIDLPAFQNNATKKWSKLSNKALVSKDGPTQAFKILVPALLVCGAVLLGLIYWELSTAKEESTEDGEEQEEVKGKGTRTKN